MLHGWLAMWVMWNCVPGMPWHILDVCCPCEMSAQRASLPTCVFSAGWRLLQGVLNTRAALQALVAGDIPACSWPTQASAASPAPAAAS